MANSNKPAQAADAQATSTRAPSFFQATVEAEAAAKGIAVSQVLSEFENQARTELGGLTDDCLFPDEVDDLLLSSNLVVDQGSIRVRAGAQPTPIEAQALEHVEACPFCTSLIRQVSPRLDERHRFMSSIRSGSAIASPEALVGMAPPSIRTLLPVLLPLSIGIVAFSKWTPLTSRPLAEAFWASFPVIVTAGCIGGIVGWVVSSGTSRWGLRVESFGKSLSASPVVPASLLSALAMVLVGSAAAYRTDRAVLDLQQALASKEIVRISNGRATAPGGAEGDSKETCVKDESDSQAEICRMLVRLPVPGAVTSERDGTSANIFWETRGERLRSLELVRAQVTDGGAGVRLVSLASGDSVPLAVAAWSKYPVGKELVAVKGDPTSRLVELLKADVGSARYPLIAAETRPK